MINTIIDYIKHDKEWYKGRHYLGCREEQILSAAKVCGAPVELLYYDTFESTGKAFKVLYENRLPKVLYKTGSFSDEDLNLIGIRKVNIPYRDYEEVEEQTFRLVDQGNTVMLYGDAFYLPHKKKDFQTNHILRTFSIFGYRKSPTGTEFDILDNNGFSHIYFKCELSEDGLKEALSRIPKEWSYLSYCEFDRNRFCSKELLPIFRRKYEAFLERYDNDIQSYLVIGQLIQKDLDTEALEALEQFFMLLSSSRFMFSSFLSTVAPSNPALELIHESVAILMHVRNIILKYKITKQVNKPFFENRCVTLANLEQRIVPLLKQYLSIDSRGGDPYAR